MSQKRETINVLVAGFDAGELLIIHQALEKSGDESKIFKINQWGPLEDINLVILDADDRNVVRKWREISARRECPPVIYIGDGAQEFQDLMLDNLLSITKGKVRAINCDKPIRAEKLMRIFSRLKKRSSRTVKDKQPPSNGTHGSGRSGLLEAMAQMDFPVSSQLVNRAA